jgi:hypothetical protein
MRRTIEASSQRGSVRENRVTMRLNAIANGHHQMETDMTINAKNIVEKAFADAKGKGKKQSLPRTPEQIAASATPQNKPEIKDDPLLLPESLRVENRTPPTQEQQKRIDDAMKAAKQPEQHQKELRTKQVEDKKAKQTAKRIARKEKDKAVASGATTAMPPTGKAAVALLKGISDKYIEQNGPSVLAKIPAGLTGAKARHAAKKAAAKRKPRTGFPTQHGDEAAAAAEPGNKKTKGGDKTTKTKTKTKTKTTSKTKRATRKSAYDWDAAEIQAKKGTVPPLPPFASYGPHMKHVLGLAKAKDAKLIKEYLSEFNPVDANAKFLRYGKLCLQALSK